MSLNRSIFLMLILAMILYGCGNNSIGDLFKEEKHARDTGLSPLIGTKVPNIELESIQNGKMKKIKVSRYRGRWVILFFYPSDFTSLYPAELKELSDNYKDFKRAGAEVLTVSTDSVYVHRAWYDNNENIRKVKYPIVSDRSGKLSRALGTYVVDKGYSHKAIFIIDPKGSIISYEVYDHSMKKSGKQILNRLNEAKAVRRSVDEYHESWEGEDEFEVPE